MALLTPHWEALTPETAVNDDRLCDRRQIHHYGEMIDLDLTASYYQRGTGLKS